MAEQLVTHDSGTTREPRVVAARRRHWWQADAPELFVRATKLEGELAVAMALLELREKAAPFRSPIVTRLMGQWRDLIDAEPTGDSSS